MTVVPSDELHTQFKRLFLHLLSEWRKSFLKNLICINVSIHKRHCCLWGRRISEHWNSRKVAHIVRSVLLQSWPTIQPLLHGKKKSETLFPSSGVFSYIKSNTIKITKSCSSFEHYRQNTTLQTKYNVLTWKSTEC